jgi:hypothetical protein
VFSALPPSINRKSLKVSAEAVADIVSRVSLKALTPSAFVPRKRSWPIVMLFARASVLAAKARQAINIRARMFLCSDADPHLPKFPMWFGLDA